MANPVACSACKLAVSAGISYLAPELATAEGVAKATDIIIHVVKALGYDIDSTKVGKIIHDAVERGANVIEDISAAVCKEVGACS